MARKQDEQQLKRLRDEADKWLMEAEWADERLFDLCSGHTQAERAELSAWMDYCYQKQQQALRQLSSLSNQRKHPDGVARLDEFRARHIPPVARPHFI
ncbi:MAG: hypothetical protein WA622_17020 [Mycobacterium sp.]|uniref:hypothetical protein n=1 Tax=Mycobacterium sp. TaxID=1785 RepID=UPI003CA87075